MRKLRTRQHVIEDLGFNNVEFHTLNAGYTMFRQTYNDYGLDGHIQTFNEEGEVEMTRIQFQLKSTDHIKLSKNKNEIKFDLSKRDLELWLLTNEIVYLFLYDAQSKKTYFLNLQSYFNSNSILLRNVQRYIRVNFSIQDQLTADTILSIKKNLKIL